MNQSTETLDYKVKHRSMITTEFIAYNDALKKYTACETGKVLEKHGYEQSNLRINRNPIKARLLPYKCYEKFAVIV